MRCSEERAHSQNFQLLLAQFTFFLLHDKMQKSAKDAGFSTVNETELEGKISWSQDSGETNGVGWGESRRKTQEKLDN